jgi:regulator-associated protein of mTOR
LRTSLFSFPVPPAGKNLQAQYERWQPRAKYKMHLDPTTEDVKKLAISCRRTAKGERVLFHYNGHGVPRPTANGEVWVFNKSYTQYIPLSIYDLQTWVGTPAIYVFDCSVAGQILSSFKQFMVQRQHEAEGFAPGGTPPQGGYGELAGDAMKDCILLCACAENELLPQTPDLPADVFTSCLTTPIKVALRWFCSRSLLRHEGVTTELIDRIPGKQTDRKSPLGELNWIFTAITDTIAWNVLPRALFQKLFRQDLLVASLFRNFLLAERIMRAANCTPVSHPRLPPTHQHPMWQAWDMAAEMCLLQLPDLVSGDSGKEYQPSPFFSEQLTAFELWLEHGSPDKRPPEQLPIVLQVLLSQVHRLRALVLLGRFLDMGPWAVDLALSGRQRWWSRGLFFWWAQRMPCVLTCAALPAAVGIFPYVLKLLQTTALDLRQTLVFIWTKIIAWDANSQVQSDLIKDGGHLYFIKHLESQDEAVGPESRAQAAFVLAAICNGHPKGQLLCAQSGLLQVCSAQLPGALTAMAAAEQSDPAAARAMALLVKWLVLCVGKLCEDMPEVTAMATREQMHDTLARLLAVNDPEIRAAAVYALSALIQASENALPASLEFSLPLSVHDMTTACPQAREGAPVPVAADAESQPALLPDIERLVVERAIICTLLEVVYDGSPIVRGEVARAFARVATGHSLLFHDAVHSHQRTSSRIMRGSSPTLGQPGVADMGRPEAAGTASSASSSGASWLPRPASLSNAATPGANGERFAGAHAFLHQNMR